MRPVPYYSKLLFVLLLYAAMLMPLAAGAALAAHAAQQPQQPQQGLSPSPAAGQATGKQGKAEAVSWRIRFLDTAIVHGDRVLLGEVAVPLGDMPEATWNELSRRELWPAPSEDGKPVNMTRPRLQEAVMRTMRDLAPYCLFPGSMALQRGGYFMDKAEIQQLVERQLATHLASLPGEGQLRDFRLPQQVFLTDAAQELELEAPRKITPGRLSLRFLVKDLDGAVRQKLTGSVFVDCWLDVPCSTVTMNRDDLIEHTKITHKRMNLAGLRGRPWDGLGGPWRVIRPIAVDQVIYQQDLAHVPTVRKGGIVTLLYMGPTIRLTVQAQAMSDGAAGETIMVRNLQSKKEVYGVVRDSSTILVNAMH
ncbi:flagellar basal body P-ring formation chaperone FlgA [Desulfovibrio sp. OttesenSCG-928-A18]|nr:flagellar basal body P-ring formation chaperone FlgA [Desulfovibrio sp. OttesenSCG-928-A18]